jgi:Flp pilus assembly protein TadG
MSTFKRFLQNTAAGTAVTFALAIVPMVLAAGVAIDTVQTNHAMTVLQGAADAAALGGGNSGKVDQAEIDAIVANYLDVNGANGVLDNVQSVVATLDEKKHTFSVQIKGSRKTSLMQIAGFEKVDLNAYAEVKLPGGEVELVLVLDNTDSMNAVGRLPALKTASKKLVDDLMKLKDIGGEVKIGVVPFGEYVNVGLKNRNKSWMDVPKDSSGVTNECRNTYPDAKWVNCRSVPNIVDGINMGSKQQCDWDGGLPVKVCQDWPWESKWYGCVGSRPDPLDKQLGSLSTGYPGLMNTGCTKELLELTDSKTDINDKIDSLTGAGNTYIPIGLLWGWNMLDSDDPLSKAKSKADMAKKDGTKALVLMTDGENTLSSTAPTHWGTDRAAADAKTADLCTNIKADGITVYTVAFMVTDAPTQDALRDCASSPANAFTADSAEQLSQAFDSIGANLQAMRISK